MYLLYQARRKVCAPSVSPPTFIVADDASPPPGAAAYSAAAANLTPVPISGPSLPTSLCRAPRGWWWCARRPRSDLNTASESVRT